MALSGRLLGEILARWLGCVEVAEQRDPHRVPHEPGGHVAGGSEWRPQRDGDHRVKLPVGPGDVTPGSPEDAGFLQESWRVGSHGRARPASSLGFSDHAGRRRHDGEDRRPLQAQGLHLPVLRDLRRAGLDVRLRPLRRAAEAEREERVVALGAAGARRHGGPRRRDPHASEGLGGVRPSGGLQRPARAVPRRLQAALPRGPPARGAAGGRAEVPGLRRRPVRAAPVQPDVRDPHGPGRRRGLHRLPAARDRPGHLRQLQERAPVLPQAAALRHRAGGQVVPQRDHAAELHLPHARVRADGDRVLRAARRGAGLVPALAQVAAASGT